MNESARQRILARLQASEPRPVPDRLVWNPPSDAAPAVERFTRMLEAAHAEVYRLDRRDWPERLRLLLDNRGVRRMLYAPATDAGQILRSAWDGKPGPALIPYDRPIEAIKPMLMHGVDAALTTAKAGIADTGSLVLWPTTEEPRLMSLLPPIHIALVEEETIAESLAALMADQRWHLVMPTNLLLVSGPSKTADIEQTLAYGVHGPKELLVLILSRGCQ